MKPFTATEKITESISVYAYRYINGKRVAILVKTYVNSHKVGEIMVYTDNQGKRDSFIIGQETNMYVKG